MRQILPVAILLLSACGGATVPAADNTPGAAIVVTQEVADASTADELAAAVGDFSAVEAVEFTFVVERNGQPAARRSHYWWPRRGALWVNDGERTVELAGIDTVDPSAWVADPGAHAAEWATVCAASPAAACADAWASFINDGFWLWAPARLSGDGVAVTRADSQVEATFALGGVTPGDAYEFTIDPATMVVLGWHFELGNGATGDFVWEDYQQVGPLKLSLLRRSTTNDTLIRFENVKVRAFAP